MAAKQDDKNSYHIVAIAVNTAASHIPRHPASQMARQALAWLTRQAGRHRDTHGVQAGGVWTHTAALVLATSYDHETYSLIGKVSHGREADTCGAAYAPVLAGRLLGGTLAQ